MTTSLPLTPATALPFPTWPSVATFHQYGYSSFNSTQQYEHVTTNITLLSLVCLKKQSYQE